MVRRLLTLAAAVTVATPASHSAGEALSSTQWMQQFLRSNGEPPCTGANKQKVGCALNRKSMKLVA
jgi:hypothetical protein